jgi:hypothetical protein
MVWYTSNPFISFDFWSFERAAVFLPAFTIGVLFPLGDLMKKVPATLGQATRPLGMAFLVGFLLAIDGTTDLKRWNAHSFFDQLPDKEIRLQFGKTPCASAPASTITLFWAEGLFKILVIIGVSLVFIATICPRKSYWFTFAGGEGALYSYLLHILVLLLYLSIMSVPGLWPVLSSPYSHLAVRLLQVALAACIALALASKTCIRMWSWLLKPTWLVNMLLEAVAASGASEVPNENVAK